MGFDSAIDTLGDRNFLAMGGVATGFLFGVLAQRTRFCLWAASMETARGRRGKRLAVWLFAFSAAMMATQALILSDMFDTGNVRQLVSRGSLSGAIVGGLIFGCGMTLSCACASRLFVLSATGNPRALVSAVFFSIVALAAKDGILSPVRIAISEWWTIDGAFRDLLVVFKAGHFAGLLFAALWFAAAVLIAMRARVSPWLGIGAGGVGVMVAAAWWFNFTVSTLSFEMVPVHALGFTAPSSDLILYALSPPGSKLTFDLGLIPGVVAGAFAAAAAARDLKPAGLNPKKNIGRSIAGGCLMGFGGVLAGGCEVGAGLSGASVFAVTAWIALWFMWIGAAATDRLVNGFLSNTNGESDDAR